METAAIDATLCSQVDQTVTVKFPGAVSSVGCDTDEVDLSPAPEGKAYRKLALTAGKRVVLSCSLPDYFSNCRLPTSATS